MAPALHLSVELSSRAIDHLLFHHDLLRMSAIDWIVLFGTLLTIAGLGVWKTRQRQSANDYLRGGNSMNWFTIGLSVMATQASAITFLSAPGLGFEKGLGFVQFYFGLPLALIIVSAVFIPIYYRLKVYTAYEYLEKRFDLKTRLLAAFLFLVQRGLAAGLTIFAPAIILSTLLGWNLNFTNFFVGALVIIYTVSGGTRAVSLTQKWQMGVILLGMGLAFSILIYKITNFTEMSSALELAGSTGRLEILNFDFDLNQRYTVWSGLTGGFFLALSYFGTDQSQVQRYLTGSSIKESRLGMMFNAIIKIPMQLFILFTGVLVFIFYLYVQPPVFFNETALENIKGSEYRQELEEIEDRYDIHYQQLQQNRAAYEQGLQAGGAVDAQKEAFRQSVARDVALRGEVKDLLLEANPDFKIKDTNYVFLTFVMEYLPVGLVGLMIALIFSAAMSSTAGELNALATTTSVDFYRRIFKRDASEARQVWMSKILTIMWGLLAIGFAVSAQLFDNLIEMVNLLGSLFYGTILGIFIVAFFMKWIRGNAVFYSALIAQTVVLLIHLARVFEIPFFVRYQVEYLWYNVIGCGLVILISTLFSAGQKRD